MQMAGDGVGTGLPRGCGHPKWRLARSHIQVLMEAPRLAVAFLARGRHAVEATEGGIALADREVPAAGCPRGWKNRR